MSSIVSKYIAALARFAGVSKAFDHKIATGKDRVSAKCPTSSRESGITLTKKQLQGHTVYYFENTIQNSGKCVLYFHGGAYLTNFSSFHWKFLIDMAKQAGCTVVTPDYPLAPAYCYKDVFAMILPLYQECVEKYGAENVIVMGDSAGGGLALAIAQSAKKQDLKTPSQIILLSPWLDAACTNTLMDEIEKRDPMLRKSALLRAANVYARGESLDNPLLSPIKGDLHEIGNISLFTGTYDILNADAKKMQEKAQAEGVEINFVEAEKMIHIWMVIGISPEAKNARKQIYSLINQDINTAK